MLHGDAQTHLRDPGRAIPEAMTALTGLTDDDVRGKHIDVEAASALIRRSDLVIAHNARFDRPFFERVLPATRDTPWACSRLEIPWRASGIETALSLLTARPRLRAAAALSAAGLGVFTPPAGVARVLIARDDDAAGRAGAERLDARCRERGLAVATLVPTHGDFNDDLVAFGAERLGARIAAAEASLTTTGQRPEPHRGQPPQQPIHPSCL